MANEFIARKGLIVSGSGHITGSLNIAGAQGLYGTTDPGANANYVYTFHSSSAFGNDLYFRNNTKLVQLDWLNKALNTGVLFGGVLSYSGSQIYISSGSGIIVDHGSDVYNYDQSTVTLVSWGDVTQSALYVTSSAATYVYMDATGTAYQQTSTFTLDQLHVALPLGKINHATQTAITSVGDQKYTAFEQSNQAFDFIRAFGPLKLNGLDISAQGGTLSFGVASGTSYALGAFYAQDKADISHYQSATVSTASMARAYQSGSTHVFDDNGGSYYTTVDVGQYNNTTTGTLSSVLPNQWTIQRVFYNALNGVCYVYYGQNLYTSLDAAVTNIATANFTESDFTKDSFIFLGYLVVRGNTTDLTDAQNKIVQSGLFRNTAGASGASIVTITLAGLSDVTITSPQTNDVLVYNGGWINSSTVASASFATTASYATTAGNVDYTNVTNKPTLVSASSQVSYTGLSDIPTGIVSSSTQVTSLLPAGTVSASSQVSYTGLSNVPVGIVSSSGQVSYTGLSNIPTGILSSSTQINALSDVSAAFATTASAATSITFTPVSASYAATASLLLGSVVSASYAQTASVGLVAKAVDIVSGSIGSNLTQYTGSFTGSLTGELIGTSSWATNAVTASFALNAGGGVSSGDSDQIILAVQIFS